MLAASNLDESRDGHPPKSDSGAVRMHAACTPVFPEALNAGKIKGSRDGYPQNQKGRQCRCSKRACLPEALTASQVDESETRHPHRAV